MLFYLALAWFLALTPAAPVASKPLPPIAQSQAIDSLLLKQLPPKKFPHLNQNKLIPLGFSKSGLFAYWYDMTNGGCGYCPSVIIRDLKRDREIIRATFDNGEINPPQIAELFRDYGIQSDRKLTLQRFPIQKSGKVINATIKNTELILTSPSFGKAAIATLSDEYSLSNFVVEGWIQSPLNNLGVVVVSVVSRGFEGENDLVYQVIGTNLDNPKAPLTKYGWGNLP